MSFEFVLRRREKKRKKKRGKTGLDDGKSSEEKAIEQEVKGHMLIDGYCHLIGTAMVQNGYYISHQIPSYIQMNDPLVVGAVKSSITEKKVNWICKKRTRYHNNGDGDCDGNNDEENNFPYQHLYSFFTVNCTKVAQGNDDSGVCLECARSENSLIKRLRNEVKIRDGSLDPKINDVRLMLSPGLMVTKVKKQKRKIKLISMRLERQKLETKKMAQLTHHQIQLVVKDRDDCRKIFDNDIEKLGAKLFDKKGVKHDDVMK